MEMFEYCSKINDLLTNGRDQQARDALIILLDYHRRKKLDYSPLINHLVRATGLYPYIQQATSSWQDRYIYEVFKVDVGEASSKALHREQSSILKMLLEKKSIAVSAPTSFGKSFIIDAFIAIARPANIMIIVPTIALMDETRRRIYKKFASGYKIITAPDVELGVQNILIFPQERAIGYVDKFVTLDLLVVDEFYKASSTYDKERSPTLVKAIIKLGKLANQRYYLAPNISSIPENVFTNGMTFVDKLDFNTVYLEKHDLYKTCGRSEKLKSEALLQILDQAEGKSLVYAASYPQIEKVSTLLLAETAPLNKPRLTSFAKWLSENYDENWKLTKLVLRGVGIHNGQIHRSLSQIQLRLFEEKEGLNTIVSTSSIIEGVNTSAENVIIWKNRKGGVGNRKLDAFTFKNIIGRGGRMLRHFVGKIYLLEEPPSDGTTELDIPFPDSILGDIDEIDYKESLTREQITKIISYREEMTALLGKSSYDRLFPKKAGPFKGSDFDFIKSVATDMKQSPEKWNGLSYLNSDDPEDWGRLLYEAMALQPIRDATHAQVVYFVKVISNNWIIPLPELLLRLDAVDIGLDMFFKLEKRVTFKLSALLHDLNELQKEIIANGTDVSPFVSKLSHAFLPSAVYQLEEYGLPRMISRKIHLAGIIDFESESSNFESLLITLNELGRKAILNIPSLTEFDHYIVEYFFDGVETDAVR